MTPPPSRDEEKRLEALRSYEILDTEPEQEFDDLTLLAAHICGTPIALISLLDENRQWFKSRIGINDTETSRDLAFCGHAILQTETFVVEDAREDERFASNPLVTGQANIRFYAGSPLITPGGHALGTLCVADHEPRALSADQKAALEALSRQVVGRLELRRSLTVLRKTVAELQQTKRELLWKTAFFEAQVNSSIDGILVVDEQGRKSLQNQRLVDLLRIPREIADDPDDGKQLRWVVERMRNPGEFKQRVDYLNGHPEEISREEIELKDGTLLDRYSAPVRGKDGKYYGRIWAFHDVTDRRRVEQDLKDAKVAAVVWEGAQRYNFLADTVPLIIWTARPDGGLDYYNRMWFDYTGLTLAETEDWGWGTVLHPDDLLPCIERWKDSYTTGKDYEIEYRFKRAADATYRWFLGRASARRNEKGQIVQWVGTCTDIDDQKRAHSELESKVAERTAELARSTRFAESIAENSTSIIYLYDLETRRSVYSNRNAAEALGYSQAQISEMGENFLPTMMHPEDLPRIIRQHSFFAEVTDNRVFDLEFRLKHANGDWHWMWSRETVFNRHPNGAAWQILGTAQDITERKRLEAQLFQSQKMETVGKLAGGIAHEFNNILTAIIGQSDLLLCGLPAGSPLEQSATEISKAAGRAATLTRQLLAYGRKQFLQPETLALNDVVAKLEGVIRHPMSDDVETLIVRAPGLRAVRADAGQIEQVIVNMTINAHEAMPNGGRLTLETANVSFDQESVAGHPELEPGEYVMLAISDTGIGMTEEIKARVFEPFFSTKGVGQGSGLGLSTCDGIIRQSGGHISVSSEPDRGTTFKIYLPQVAPQAPMPIQRLDATALPGGAETLLLVENDPGLREMAAALLRRLGYTVFEVTDGAEALSLQQRHAVGSIDLLFTDVAMPSMNGWELADRVRTWNPHLRVLFTSTSTECATVHQGAPAEGVALLKRPFAPSALAHKLREVLDQPVSLSPDLV